MFDLGDFRMGWRLLARHPLHSLVMVLGLATGFAVWFLVLGFTRYEYGFDRDVPGVDHVHVVKARPGWGRSHWSENVPLAMKTALEGSGLPLQATTVLPLQALARVGDRPSPLEVTIVDPAFTTVFGARAAEGDLAAALSRPDAVALTRRTAMALFGDAHAVGRQLQVNGQAMQVAAVMEDPARTSSVQYSALAGPTSAAWTASERARDADPWNYYEDDGKDIVTAKVYVRLDDPRQRAAAAQAIERAIESSALRGHLGPRQLSELSDRPLMKVALGPLADSYLDSDARENSGPKGDPVSNFAMNGVALLILLLTAGNYVNLANIRVVQRQREIAMRKVLGVRPARLAAQLLAESVLVSLAAAVLGALLAVLLLPAWSIITDHEIAAALGTADWLAFAAIVAASGLLVGLGAGAYPAWTALRTDVSPVLGGRAGGETAGGLLLRRLLTVAQFGISMFVAAMIVTIAWQIHFLKGIDYGYRVDGLTLVKLPADLGDTEVQAFAQALARRPEVASVAGGSTRSVNREFTPGQGAAVTLPTRLVGPGYFETLGLGAIAGRVLDPKRDVDASSGAVVLDRRAAARLGYADPSAAVGRFVTMEGRTVPVVGIAGEVRNGFTLGAPRPQVYALSARTPELVVRGSGDDASTQAAIAATWTAHFPTRLLSMRNQRAQLEQNAGGPEAVLQSCAVIAAVVVPLAIFSIYALAALMVQRRSREFVLRKLHGARPRDIVVLLAREFGILQGVAAGIALPLAFFGGRAFVERFADQAPIGAWALVVALAGAVAVTVVATGRHIVAASRLAPADVLRAS